MSLRFIRSPLDQLSRHNYAINPRRCMDAIHLYAHQLNPAARTITHPTTRTMSSITLKDLAYISREDLSAHVSSPSSSNNIAIIDVRDSDHVGGHIKGSTWVPSSQLDYKTPELVRTLKDKEVVVFHCALSQQRGPSAALRYLREKRRLDPEGVVESKGIVKEGEGAEEERPEESTEESKGKKVQKVVVLDGGFTKWQEKFGEDERLTEGYQKDIWEFGYDG
jgi:rhodanese-related sulfurtransferase